MISFAQLEYLVAVDEHRHFGRAAEACNITQPTLSMQLQKLEEALGGAFFDRSRKPVIPTDRGRLFIQKARVILEQRNELYSISASDGGDCAGELRIGVIATLAPYLLPKVLTPFSKAYPHVKLSIEESKTDLLLKQIEEEKLDAVLCATPLPDSDLQKKHLFYEPFHLWTSPKHPIRSIKSLNPGDLESNQMWFLDSGHCLRDQSLKLCSKKFKKDPISNINLKVDNLETLKNLVQQGIGYTLLPALSLDYLVPGAMARNVVSFDSPQPARHIVLVYKRKQLKIRLIDAFVKTVMDNIPKNRVNVDRNAMKVIGT